MTDTVEKINQVIESGLLIKGLYNLPINSANDLDIRNVESKLPFKLSDQYKEFLKFWNGANLDIVRIFGVGQTENFIPSLLDCQSDYNNKGLIIIASDPAGFVYGQNIKGGIFSIDSEGEETSKVADSFNNFVCDYLFGPNASAFGGHSWAEELMNAGIYNNS